MAQERIAVKPRYTNNAQNRIECEIHYPKQNRKVRAVINKTSKNGGINPDWQWIMDTQGVEKVEQNTRDFIAAIRTKESRDKQLKERDEGEQLFNLKLEIFELPEVRESKNSKLKSKIRRATTPVQVQTFAAALIAYEQIKSEEHTSDEPKAKKAAPKKRAPRKTTPKKKAKVTIVDTINDDKRDK